MRYIEIKEAYYKLDALTKAKAALEDRFRELGIEVAYDYFMDWFYLGQFSLPYRSLDRFEQAFYLINSVLPPTVLKSYANLPVLYRGFEFSAAKIKQIYNGGLPIKSRIMAWAPLKVAKGYTTFVDDWVILQHKPKQNEVILAMTPETMKFLHIQPVLVANHREAILSIPMLSITPEMVFKTSIDS